jgi:hypothetical protein
VIAELEVHTPFFSSDVAPLDVTLLLLLLLADASIPFTRISAESTSLLLLLLLLRVLLVAVLLSAALD